MILLRLARWIGLTLVAAILLVLGGWSALAIWFRFDTTEPIRALLVGIVVLLTIVAAMCLATSRRSIALAAFAAFAPFAAFAGRLPAPARVLRWLYGGTAQWGMTNS